MASSAAKENGKVTQATEYTVLEQRTFEGPKGDSIEAWVIVGTADATIRTNAVAEVAKEREGVWRAVPTRNWSDAIRTRKETITKLKVETVEPF